jgi:hypothetical protein
MTNILYTNDNFHKNENKKFSDKIMDAWFWYMFEYRVWRNQVQKIKKDYNGFGMELPAVQVELEDLFANFIKVEVKKTKNKKYQQFLTALV